MANASTAILNGCSFFYFTRILITTFLAIFTSGCHTLRNSPAPISQSENVHPTQEPTIRDMAPIEPPMLDGKHPYLSNISLLFAFDFDSYAPKFVAQDIDQIVEHLEIFPDERVSLEGCTCDLGDADYNYRLGLSRANAVNTLLLQRGIASERISVASFGELKPDFPNINRACRERNRSVRLQVLCR